MKVGSNPGNLFFDWYFTNWCNYKCYYCSVKHTMTDTPKTMEESNPKLVLARLKLLKDPFYIELAGGEPTLHDEFISTVNKLIGMELCKEVAISTNLSRSVKFFQQIQPHEKFCLCASYHATDSHENFVDKCIELNKTHNVVVKVILTDDRQYWDKIKGVMDRLIVNNVDFAPIHLHSARCHTVTYDDDLLDHFQYYYDVSIETNKEDNGIRYEFDDGTVEFLHYGDIISRGLHKLKGINCESYYYTISLDGTIRRLCSNENIRVNMQDIKKTIVCPVADCNCETRLDLIKYDS